MSTPLHPLEEALASVPNPFRKKLIESYTSVKSAWTSRQFDSCGLRAGKFCEVMARLIQETLTGSHTPFGQQLPPFDALCLSFEKTPKAAGPESLRILIPRCLNFVYTLRNKRSIGHVGGDLDANEIDASTALRCVDWCLSELIRNVHTLSLEEAQALLDSLAERELVAVWAVAGKKRVLRSGMSRTEQTLVLLYSEPDVAVPVEDLATWIEVLRISNYRSDVLRPMHRKRLIELDADTDTVVLSPLGIGEAEKILL